MTTPTTQRPRRGVALRSQEGITMIVTMGVMVVTSLLLAATFTLARSEIHLTSTDTAEKKAYYAAEAGIEDYEDHLTQDGNYLSYCTDPPAPNPALNQAGETVNRATIPSTIPGEPTDEQYAIQLLPAESHPVGDAKCDPNHLVETMLEEKSTGAAGTFRIESTGYSGNTERSVVATFKNANFVSFVWYTKYETGDPSLYGEPPASEPNRYTQCGQFYGERPGSPCSEFDNYFISGESVKGPMHTEDHAGICGTPVFGRNSSDRIEFRSEGFHGDEGFSGESYCPGGSDPTFAGSHILPNEVPSIEPPPGDEELKHIVEPAYLYEDKTEIALEGSTMTVSKWKEVAGKEVKESTPGVPFPPNGVIYVEGGCSKAYSPFGPVPGYNEDYDCGNVYVHGNYTSSLTIASENDIVINGNITTPVNAEGTPTSNALLGLIANNFVRIFHPVVGGPRGPHFYYDCNGAEDSPEDLKEPTIYAAILAVKHAVIVDNFDCGAPSLGHLNIYGAVAGLFSNGMTGVFSGSSIIAGYPYDANYDDRLQIEEPPHFLNPVQAAWYVQRQTLVPNLTP